MEIFNRINTISQLLDYETEFKVLMESGKVKESGIYDAGGGFFIIDVDTPEDLSLLL